jgi:hypothetical protein
VSTPANISQRPAGNSPGLPNSNAQSTPYTSAANASAYQPSGNNGYMSAANSNMGRSVSQPNISNVPASQSYDSYGPARSASYTSLTTTSVDHFNMPSQQQQPPVNQLSPDSNKSPLSSLSTTSSQQPLLQPPQPPPRPDRAIGQPEKCPLPEIPQSFPELRQLTEEQLDNLVNEPKAFKVRLVRSPCFV